ncbi:hypothetical protein B0H10DRAFT_1782212, partial [Mycena sp. CBHHK59/15]
MPKLESVSDSNSDTTSTIEPVSDTDSWDDIAVHDEPIPHPIQHPAPTQEPDLPETTPVKTSKLSKWFKFGSSLKQKAIKTFLKLFQKKVGYPPLRRWVHHIDTGDVQLVRIRGRPHSPIEQQAIKNFIDDSLKE